MYDVRQNALAYLQQHQVMTLATRGPKSVWAAAVFYVNSSFNLFFLSAGHTRHALNMEDNPRVAATIQEDYKDWAAIKGIQLEGTTQLLQGKHRREAIALYQAKYSFVVHAEPVIKSALAKVNWYCLKPERLYFIDNERGFGQRQEVNLQQ